jgi:hypothetical protein
MPRSAFRPPQRHSGLASPTRSERPSDGAEPPGRGSLRTRSARRGPICPPRSTAGGRARPGRRPTRGGRLAERLAQDLEREPGGDRAVDLPRHARGERRLGVADRAEGLGCSSRTRRSPRYRRARARSPTAPRPGSGYATAARSQLVSNWRSLMVDQERPLVLGREPSRIEIDGRGIERECRAGAHGAGRGPRSRSSEEIESPASCAAAIRAPRTRRSAPAAAARTTSRRLIEAPPP